MTLWFDIPQGWRDEFVSAVHTFIGAFVFQVGFQLQPLLAAGQLPTGRDALIAFGIAVTRSATKFAVVALQAWIATQWAAYKQSNA